MRYDTPTLCHKIKSYYNNMQITTINKSSLKKYIKNNSDGHNRQMSEDDLHDVLIYHHNFIKNSYN